MKKTWKWALPALLLVAVTILFSTGSLAAFAQSINLQSAAIRAKSFVFYVNESASQRQSLGDATIGVDESHTYNIVLDGRSSETPVDATVRLSVSHDGTWPDGLSIQYAGADASSGFTASVSDLQSAGETKTVSFTVVWDDPHLSSYDAFEDFALHLDVTVTAEQAN